MVTNDILMKLFSGAKDISLAWQAKKDFSERINKICEEVESLAVSCGNDALAKEGLCPSLCSFIEIWAMDNLHYCSYKEKLYLRSQLEHTKEVLQFSKLTREQGGPDSEYFAAKFDWIIRYLKEGGLVKPDIHSEAKRFNWFGLATKQRKRDSTRGI